MKDPTAYQHLFKTAFGLPPDKGDLPLCGAHLPDSWDFALRNRSACPACEEIRTDLADTIYCVLVGDTVRYIDGKSTVEHYDTWAAWVDRLFALGVTNPGESGWLDDRSVTWWREHKTVDVDEWEPDPDRAEGYLRKTHRKTVREVFEAIRAIIATPDGHNWFWPSAIDEYFSIYATVHDDRPWPEGRTVVFPVTGGSEGHYVHVEVLNIDGTDRSELLLLGKGFAGFDATWAFSKRLARILNI